MKNIRCIDCKHFIRDTVGNGSGIGVCNQYELYKAKNPSEEALKQARLKLGNRMKPNYTVSTIFSGGTAKTRNCVKYEQI